MSALVLRAPGTTLRVSVERRLAGPREPADTAPGQPGQQRDGAVLVDGARAGHPVSGADLGQPGQPDREQPRLVLLGAGVFRDRRGDRGGALAQRTLDPFADGRLVAQVALEDEPERLAVARDEAEVRGQRRLDALAVVGRRIERGTDTRDEVLAVPVEQREVEVEL